LVLQENGRILVAGTSGAAGFRFAVVRYTAQGRLDQSFGVGGITLTGIGGGSLASGIGLQSTGRIVVGGTVAGPRADVALAGYLP
jgi:hypothetical protein